MAKIQNIFKDVIILFVVVLGPVNNIYRNFQFNVRL